MTTINSQNRPGIVQVCYVVHNLERAMRTWIDLCGAGPFFVADFKMEQDQFYRGLPTTLDVRVAIAYSGSLNIELLKPVGAGPSVYHEILETRGEGIHHFYRTCANIDVEIRRLADLGCPLVASSVVPGVTRACFIDTTAQLGVFTELQELSAAALRGLAEIHQAHLSWDGHTDPVRDYPLLRN